MNWRERVAQARAWVRAAVTGGPHRMLSGLYSTSSGEPPVRGTEELLRGAETMPWLHGIASKVAASVADTEWRLYAVRDSRGYTRQPRTQRAGAIARRRQLDNWRRAGALEEQTDHAFFTALERPNTFHDRVALLRLTQVSLDVVGDAFWCIERNALGAPAGFWYLAPQWVAELPTPSRPRFVLRSSAWQVEVPERDIVWFQNPAASAPYGRGAGVGWALGDELEVDEYAAKMLRQYFFARARPDFLVMVQDSAGEESARRLERDWLARLQGWWRAGRPYFMRGKVEVKELTQPNLDQLVYPKLRETQRDLVRQAGWGMPPELLGILDNSNRSTISAAEYLYYRHVIEPRVELVRGALQRQVIPQYDDRLILDYDSQVPADREHELAVRKAFPSAWLVDELRALAGDEPLPAGRGQVHVVPLGQYATSDLADQTQRPATSVSVTAQDGGAK